MCKKPPRPEALTGANRAADLDELLAATSDPKTSQSLSAPQVLPARVHVFVSRTGRVGYWIPRCPFCGHEHIHGSYEPFDPRSAEGLGWRCSHCDQGGGTYELVLAPEPARFAPGAKHSFHAKHTMKWLRSIGMKTSDEVIPSERPCSWWRWR